MAMTINNLNIDINITLVLMSETKIVSEADFYYAVFETSDTGMRNLNIFLFLRS